MFAGFAEISATSVEPGESAAVQTLYVDNTGVSRQMVRGRRLFSSLQGAWPLGAPRVGGHTSVPYVWPCCPLPPPPPPTYALQLVSVMSGFHGDSEAVAGRRVADGEGSPQAQDPR